MRQRRKLLVIDDDPAICRYLRRGLAHDSYEVAEASAETLLARLDEWHPDVVLLDLSSPSAKSQVQAVKACSPTPLIGLLPSEDMQAVIEALDAGVDDCVAKPFGLDALAAQIRKVLRRDVWCRGETPYFSSPTLQIDSIRCQVYRSGRPLALSRRQFRLLKMLLDADGRVLTHHDLLRAIWAGGADGATIGSLRQAIAELRRKIEPDPRRPRHILSQSRTGYRFDRTPEYRTGRLL